MPNRAFLFWLLDGLLAIALAAALAVAVSLLAERTPGAELLLALTLLCAAGLARGGAQVLAADAGQHEAARAKQAWRVRAFGAVLRAPAGIRVMLGEQTADATDRIEDLDGYHARFQPLRLAAVATPLMVAAAAAMASWLAAAIMLATLVPFAFGMVFAGTAAVRAAARQLDALSKLSGLFIDRVRALPIILGFGAQDRVVRQMGAATQDVARRTLAVLRVAFLSSAVMEFFAAISVALVAVYCGFSLLGLLPFRAPETLTLGRALFVLVLAPEFYLPMRRMAAAYHDKQIGEAALERLTRLAPTDGARTAGSADLTAPPGIDIRDLVIAYEDRRIGPFTFTAPAGEMTVISGPSGAGKSSLLNALLGLAPISSGEILLDGAPLVATQLQGAVSWAGQTTLFLPGTLADNIRLARPDASDEDIAAAAASAGLTALIAGRPAGLQTPINPRGSGLSGGERRRIGIARALLLDAPLWLLDEPTADLDAASADALIALIRSASLGRTVLLVTHDPAVAALADHHVVIA